MSSFRVISAVIELADGGLVRMTPSSATGLQHDGVTWDGRLAFSGDEWDAIEAARAQLFHGRADA